MPSIPWSIGKREKLKLSSELAVPQRADCCEAANLESRQEDPRHARAWKTEMQQAHDAVVTTIQPILHGWLQYPKDGETFSLLADILN